MIWEIATIEVVTGHETFFEQAVEQAAQHFRSAPGCRDMRLWRSIENPCVYHLYVAWDSVEAHVVDFRSSDGYQKWRTLAAPHFAGTPRVEHFQSVGAFE
jgi:heme-degrading monooxygenase HmoA